MFLIGTIIVSIIFSIQPFIKKNIMKEFSIDEYTVYSSLVALFFPRRIWLSTLPLKTCGVCGTYEIN